MLIIFGGLPGVGKTTVARALARRVGAFHVRVDTIEAAMLRWRPGIDVEDGGYRIAYEIAADNLRLGAVVIADTVNPIELTRAAWREVALHNGARFFDVEFVCADANEHQARVEARQPDIEGQVLPTWEDVQTRSYAPRSDPRLVLDTHRHSVDACAAMICAELSAVESDAFG